MPRHGAPAQKWTSCSHASGLHVHKQLGKVDTYREVSGKFGVVALTAYENAKVNTTGTDRAWARCLGTTAGATIAIVPVPGYGAQISARAATESYIQKKKQQQQQ